MNASIINSHFQHHKKIAQFNFANKVFYQFFAKIQQKFFPLRYMNTRRINNSNNIILFKKKHKEKYEQ